MSIDNSYLVGLRDNTASSSGDMPMGGHVAEGVYVWNNDVPYADGYQYEWTEG